MKDKLIKVQGHGSITCTPDLVIVSLTLADTHLSYAEANARLNERLARLREDFARAGFEADQLKTADYNVRKETEYTDRRHVLKGFNVRHSLELRLPFEKEHLNRVLEALTGSAAHPELDIEFTVSNPESARAAVLAAAVHNARSRAQVIASAAGVQLGAIVQIEYGYTELTISSRRFCLEDSPLETSAPDFEPANVRAEETVMLTWEISE